MIELSLNLSRPNYKSSSPFNYRCEDGHELFTKALLLEKEKSRVFYFLRRNKIYEKVTFTESTIFPDTIIRVDRR